MLEEQLNQVAEAAYNKAVEFTALPIPQWNELRDIYKNVWLARLRSHIVDNELLGVEFMHVFYITADNAIDSGYVYSPELNKKGN